MTLNQREKRFVKIGVLIVTMTLVLVYVPQGIGHWHDIRQEIARMENALDRASGYGPKQKALAMIVPVLEMPETDPQQMLRFRDKMNEQLQKAGIDTEPVQVGRLTKPNKMGYRQLPLSYKGKCPFDKFMDLLVSLKENPYLAGIERLKIQFDPQQEPQQRREMDVELTVSTFVKVEE